MRSIVAAVSVGALIAATSLQALASLHSGSLLNGTISQSYSSNNAWVGESVVLTNVTSDDGSGSVSGGKLYGTVTSVQKASQGRPGKISIGFTRLVNGSGASYYVNTTVTKMQANTKNNALKEAGGAVAGMLIGNMLGKTLFHASGGGIVGAAGGFLLAKNNRENVNIPSGSVVQVQINSVTRRQTH